MKIEPFLIASTVNIAVGQRLVRKICEKCKEKKTLSETELQSLKESLPQDIKFTPKSVYEGKGCNVCGDSGYLGRIGIYEVLEVSPRIRETITAHGSAAEIERIAREEGMTTMIQDGLKKVEEGTTSIEEVLRVMHE